MTGTVAILNVGAGDIKVKFDKHNMAETIRARRVVTDMLRRGCALAVEVEQSDGTKAYQRVAEFRPETDEYIIVDWDLTGTILPPASIDIATSVSRGGLPAAAAALDDRLMGMDGKDEATGSKETTDQNSGSAEGKPASRRRTRRAIPASGVRAVAIARTAGG